MPTAALDQEPPSLAGEAEIRPEVGTVGTSFEICFEVTEPLAAPPETWLDVGGRAAPLTPRAGSDGEEGLRHCFGYVADGSEQPGERALSADLVDESGNPALGLMLGILRLDLAPPRLVAAPELSAGVVNEDAEPTLLLVFDEALDGVPTVRMGPADAPAAEAALAWTRAAGDERSHTLRYQPTGGEPEGVHTVWLLGAADLAGNTSPAEELARLTLDFEPPAVSEEPPATVTPAVAAARRAVQVEVWTRWPRACRGCRVPGRGAARWSSTAAWRGRGGCASCTRSRPAVTARTT